MIHKFVHEIPVVRHHDKAARKVHQEFFKHGEREDVQVVGGLVQHEEVGVAHQDAQQMKSLRSPPLSRRMNWWCMAWKQEALEKLGGGELGAAFQGDPIGDVTHGVDDLPSSLKVPPSWA